MFFLATALAPLVVPKDDMVLSGDVRLKPGRYVIADKNGDGVLKVRTAGTKVDFNGAVMVAPAGANQAGTGVAVSAPGVTLVRAVVQGYDRNLVVAGGKGTVVKEGDFRSGKTSGMTFQKSPGTLVTFCTADKSGVGLEFSAGSEGSMAVGLSVGGCGVGVSVSSSDCFLYGADAFGSKVGFLLGNARRVGVVSSWAEDVNVGYRLAEADLAYVGYNVISKASRGVELIGGSENWLISNTLSAISETAFLFNAGQGKGEHVLGLNLIRNSRLAYTGDPTVAFWTRSETLSGTPVDSKMKPKLNSVAEYPERDGLKSQMERAREHVKDKPSDFRTAREKSNSLPKKGIDSSYFQL